MDIGHSIKLLECPKVVYKTIDFRFTKPINLAAHASCATPNKGYPEEQRRTISPDRRSFTAFRNQRHSNCSLQTRLSSCDDNQQEANFLPHRRSPVFKLLKFDSNGQVTNETLSTKNTCKVPQFLDFRNQTTFHRPVSLGPDFAVKKRKRASADSQTVVRLNHDNIQRWLMEHGIKSKLRSFSTANFQLDFNLLKSGTQYETGRSQSHDERLDQLRRSLLGTPRLVPFKLQPSLGEKTTRTTSTGHNTIERMRGLKVETVSYFESGRPNSDFVSTGARFNCATKTNGTQQQRRCLTPDRKVCVSNTRHLTREEKDVENTNSVVAVSTSCTPSSTDSVISQPCEKMAPDSTKLTVSGDKIKLTVIVNSSSVFDEKVHTHC